MVQDIDDGGRHGLVGVGEEEAYLPHFVVAELGLERRHAGEADAVLDLPIGFADRVVADSDDVGVALMRLEQGWGVGIHVIANGGRPVVQAVAERATLSVYAGAGGEVRGVGPHVSADHFPLNPCIERHVHKLALVGERRVIDSDRDFTVREVSQDSQRNEDNAKDQAKQESKHEVSYPPPFFILRVLRRGLTRNRNACVQWLLVPIS